MIEYFYAILPLVIQYKYLAVFTALTIAGFGVPIPEEATIVVSGYLAAIGQMDPVFTLVVCYVGVLTGDLVTYFMGRYAGRWFLGSRLMRWLINRQKLAQAQYYYRRYGPRALLLARQAPGLRFPTYFTSGMLKVRLFDFLLYDSAAALVSMPVVFFITYFFGPRVTQALSLIVHIGNVTTIAVLSIAGLLAAYFIYRKYFRSS